MMGAPKQRATAPAMQTAEKKAGFFKRHLGRRRSSVSFPHQPPSPQQAQAPSSRPANPTISIQAHDELDKPDSKDAEDTTLTKLNSYESYVSGVDSIEGPRQSSKAGGIRWAGVPSSPPSQPLSQPPTRPRRTSSAGHSRRGSIYLRIEGLYSEGVDVGAGSKARRLSVALPDQLRVDECPLSDHFSLLSRAGKKDIGEGGAAVVRLMQSKTAGTGKDKLFAVKEFREWEPAEELEDDYDRKIKSEFAIAKSCQNPNIVETFRLCYSDKKWFHVMEYCDQGDLNDIITKGYFNREDKNCIFKQLLRGVDYLHSRGIAHRDLKSENLLVSHSGCLKIADFGTAEVFSGTHPGVKGCRRPSLIPEDCEIRLCAPGIVGSRPYMAPEIIEHKDMYDPRGVDVWSCAIVFLTLCVGGTPWECASRDVKNYNIFCNTWDAWLKKYPDGEIIMGRELPAFVGTKQFQLLEDMGSKTLVMGMLHPDPSKRWSARDVVESKPFMEYPCCQQEGYSDDIKTRQRKALHDHRPPKNMKSSKKLAVKPK